MNTSHLSKLRKLTVFVLGLFVGGLAQAQIVYTDIVDIVFSNSPGGNVQIDLGTGGAQGSAILGTGPNTWDFRVNGISGPFQLFIERNTGAALGEQTDLLSPLALNTLINASSTWSSANDSQIFVGSSTGNLFGVKFDAGSGTNYGWIRIDVNGDGSFTLTDFAYEQSGAGILAGATTAVPEPASTAAVCGLLAVSALLWHRRTKSAAA